MGNQCETICCEGSDLKLGVKSSQNFDKLIHSKLVENQFPEELIPETVKQKLKLLQIEPDFRNSQIWKYEESEVKPQDVFNVAYAVINKANIDNKLKNQSEQNIIANKNVPSPENQHQKEPQKQQKSQKRAENINPDRFENATIYLFKSSIISQNSQSQIPSQQTLTLKKIYHGPINPQMRASDATVILENGEYYKGNVFQFNFEGKGEIRNALGNHSYDGTWQNNKPHGSGVQQLTDKFQYNGDFVNGKWHGQGKLTLNSNSKIIIDGTFMEGNIEGPGKISSSNGRLIYEGNLKNGKQHGTGKWYGQNGQLYEGEFVQGKKQGFGKYTFKSGRQYEGIFKDDMPNGDGQLIEGNKRTKGYWYRGENIVTKSVVNNQR